MAANTAIPRIDRVHSQAPIDASRRRWTTALALAGLFAPTVSPAALSRVQSWPARKPAPALALDDLDGRAMALAAWRGQAVLLNFWASWCEPCVAEMEQLARLAERHAAAGDLRVVGINHRESAETARRSMARLPFVFNTLLDRHGTAFKAWTQGVLPTSVLVDRNGQPRVSVAGEMDWTGSEATALIEPLLARCGTGTACAPRALYSPKETS